MHVKGLEACEKAKELGKANDLMSMASQLNEMCDWNDSLRAEVGEGREATKQRDQREPL